MTHDIEECHKAVINAPGKRNLPAGETLARYTAMPKNDRVGSIGEGELKSLRHRIKAPPS